ncbi:MAG: archease [Desulfomonile tiedjei]|nr:archease [Desulfomonile tiedjei]
MKKMTKAKKKADPGWKLLDHTADIRMEVRGKTLEGLFLNAADGLVNLLAPDPRAETDTELDVVLDSDNAENLLVDWLREILFYNQTRDFIPVQTEVVELSDKLLRAKLVGGVRLSEEEAVAEIKAVTYHGLSITKNDQGYVARIVFDI